MSRFGVGSQLREHIAMLPPRQVVLADGWVGTDILAPRELAPGERPPSRNLDSTVPEQVRAADCEVLAAWIATSASLQNHGLAFRVLCRFPDVDALGADVPFDREAARRAVEQLRAGQAADTATVVRLARHRLETP